MPAQSTIIFNSSLLRIGLWRCPVDEPRFTDTGPITSGHLLVFPRTSVRITHAGSEPIIADPNNVMFYNWGQEYRRDPLSPRGDVAEWFAFAPDLLTSALALYEPARVEQPMRPFRWSHTGCDAQSYLCQRLVVRHVLTQPQPDLLYVEESMLGVLDTLAASVYRLRSSAAGRAQPWGGVAGRALARAAQEVVTQQFRTTLALSDLASAVYSSPYQLCRVFRQQTGYTIHQYLNQLRLRTALEALAEGAENLTELALDLGYSSHSHFTQAFRQSFGLPPSSARFAVRCG